ncbi:hypothetical protein SCLCIDRAFT_596995 [Scleroderma citrinum Foug A]|uniref:Uncharacterized protein n=1 Tax=Scleroderma citrinum Foug A TaxID=1036808 RepID=A0A0C3AIW1_9AGAM|nr:hypothetical protein SCLCIDRAFT_596995 [Scleroderma citrinum Foug A]
MTAHLPRALGTVEKVSFRKHRGITLHVLPENTRHTLIKGATTVNRGQDCSM